MKRTETRKIMVGNVQIGGQNKVVIQSMCNTKSKKANRKWFSKVGYVYQNPVYQLFMPTLLSEISFKAKSEEMAREMINAFGLSGLEQRNPQSLSEGQKRRASIAAVCASEPPVLFLDYQKALVWTYKSLYYQ